MFLISSLRSQIVTSNWKSIAIQNQNRYCNSKIMESGGQFTRSVPEESITDKIFLIRSQKVMIDRGWI